MTRCLLRPWLTTFVMFAGAALASAQDSNGRASSVLRPGDVLRVSVWNQPDWSGEFEVKTDSTLRHAQYNSVKVGGVSLAEARSRIAKLLRNHFQDLPLEVTPLFKVSIGGEVRLPNLYSLPPETTIADAIIKAGGPSERGRLEKVKLVRGGRTTTVDLSAPGTGAGILTVQSGDQITVTRRSDVLRDWIGPLAGVAASILTAVNLLTR